MYNQSEAPKDIITSKIAFSNCKQLIPDSKRVELTVLKRQPSRMLTQLGPKAIPVCRSAGAYRYPSYKV
jgi:hypothetical protein